MFVASSENLKVKSRSSGNLDSVHLLLQGWQLLVAPLTDEAPHQHPSPSPLPHTPYPQVSDLAQILNVPIREVQAALAIASRLGFATPVTEKFLGVDSRQV